MVGWAADDACRSLAIRVEGVEIKKMTLHHRTKCTKRRIFKARNPLRSQAKEGGCGGKRR